MIGISMGIGRGQRGADGGGGGSAPANTALPAVGGSAQQGQMLTASPGTWTGSPAPGFAYQWRRGGADIAGATAASYTATGADVGLTLAVRVTASNASGSASATSAATAAVTQSLAALPSTPASRWHPQFSSVTAAGGRVVSATDLQGLAGVTEGAAGNGPKAMTDALGRAFWRFEESEFLNVAAGLAANSRDVAVFFVGRMHRALATNTILSLGNRAAGTNTTTGNGSLDSATAAQGAPFVRCTSGAPSGAGSEWMVTGAQMQVLGAASRTTAGGGRRLWVNARTADVAQSTISVAPAGAEIGRNAQSGTGLGAFDLYELMVFTPGLTNAQGDAVAAALVAHYGIPAVASQLVLEGDSITQGTGAVTSGLNGAMVLTEPGQERIPAGWRVVNMGVSGAQVADLTARRDAATSWAGALLPGGQNVMAFEIGRNDMSGGGGNQTETQHYANVVAYLNTAATGVLQRGWTVRVMANIASAAALMARITPYRAMLRAAQFLTDTGSNAGGPFAGRVSVVSTDLIEDGAAGTVFETSGDAGNTAYYAGDNTHPSVQGAVVRITGGTTPANGVAAGL